jgi:hypothetical protein
MGPPRDPLSNEKKCCCIFSEPKAESFSQSGLIWYFRKSFEGRTLQIVAEVHENRCYGIAGYWLQ